MLLLYLFKIPLKYVLTITNSLLQVLTVAGLIGPLGLLAVRNVFTIAEGRVPTQLRALEENIVSGSISKLETAQTGFVKVTHSQISNFLVQICTVIKLFLKMLRRVMI